ncbi:eukaryotic translation initiation factor 4E transporter [Tetranychus urticae]|uniref:Uncharacterized protein n=1 Tax=Tetranychus urticae TaxID=32264 RepID=T1KBQ7_TETUR|nr:eukaryotic translation initiation factor 4E transporter [Tetranychus urticae]
MSDVINGFIKAQKEDKMVHVNGSEANLSEETPIVKTKRFTYSKEELIEISKQPYCGKRPKFLDPDYVNKSGLWDPDLWMNYKNPSNKPIPSSLPSTRDHDLSAPGLTNKNIRGPPKRVNGESESSLRNRKDPRDRVKEESQDDIVLSPQRRSFGTGCHIVPVRNEQPVATGTQAQRSSVGKADNHAHQQDRREEQLLHRNDNVNRRIGSGRLLNQRDKSNLEWSKSRDREEEIENRRSNLRYTNGNSNNSGRYDYDRRSSMNNRRYGHHDRRDSRNHEEEEPEWFTGGPTSQHDTIELKGFEEEMPEDEVSKGRQNHHRPQNQHVEPESRGQGSLINNGDVKEHFENHNHYKSNGVEEHESGSKEIQDFDINEMFKFEGWKNIVSMSPENVTSIPGFTDPNVSGQNQNGGTSRFAQWFNVSRTETESPIDRLLQNVTFSSSYNAAPHDSRRSSVQEIERTLFNHNHLGNGSHRIDPTVLGLRNPETYNGHHHHNGGHINTNGTENGAHGHNDSPVNKGKDLLNLLQKANININDLMQQQSSLPTLPKFEHARSVEEIEAGLRSFPISGSNQHDGNQQDKNVEHSDFNRLLLKAMSRRGTQFVNPNSKAPVVIPLNVRPPIHLPGKPQFVNQNFVGPQFVNQNFVQPVVIPLNFTPTSVIRKFAEKDKDAIRKKTYRNR